MPCIIGTPRRGGEPALRCACHLCNERTISPQWSSCQRINGEGMSKNRYQNRFPKKLGGTNKNPESFSSRWWAYFWASSHNCTHSQITTALFPVYFTIPTHSAGVEFDSRSQLFRAAAQKGQPLFFCQKKTMCSAQPSGSWRIRATSRFWVTFLAGRKS